MANSVIIDTLTFTFSSGFGGSMGGVTGVLTGGLTGGVTGGVIGATVCSLSPPPPHADNIDILVVKLINNRALTTLL
jgi:hypothetical protein